MFRNGLEVDGGGTAYLGPTTIIEMTIPMSQSSSCATLDDSWVLAGPISCPPICGVVHSLDGRRNVRSFVFIFARMHVLWLDVVRYSLQVSVLPSPIFFFFFFLWRLGLYSVFMSSGGVVHVVATCLAPTGQGASFLVGTFQFPAFFKAKGEFL